MKKHILILGLILMFMGLVMNAQTTVSIPNETSLQGTVVLPVEVDPDLGDVGSLTLHISYDDDVLEFVEFADNPFEGDPNFITQVQNGEISVVWFSTTPVEITDKLFDLTFNYTGGTSALAFTGTNEITDEAAQAYNITFVDGSVGPIPVTLSLSDEIVLPGEQVSVSLDALNLDQVGSMTLFIEFDSDALEFVGLENDAVGFSDSGGADGNLTLAWFDTTPLTVEDGKLADLVFNFTDGTSPVAFGASTEVTDSDGDPISVVLEDGSVSQPSVGMSLEDVEHKFSSIEDDTISVSLGATLFDNVGSFTVKVQYDDSMIDFAGYENFVSGSLQANQSAGVLTLAYFNTSGLTIAEGGIVDLNFVYVGTDDPDGMTTDLGFVEAESEITDLDGNVLAPQYTDGSITFVLNQAPEFTAVLGDTTVTEGDTLTFQYEATDPNDADVLMFLLDGPGTIVDSTGLYSWATVSGDAGEYNVVVGVTDGTDTVTVASVVTVESGIIIPEPPRPPHEVGDTLNVNGSFEYSDLGNAVGTHYWSIAANLSGASATIIEDAQDGDNRALQINAGSAGTGNPWDLESVNEPFYPAEGDVILASVWLKADSDGRIADLYLGLPASGDWQRKPNWDMEERAVLTTEWQQFTYPAYQADSTDENLSMRLGIEMNFPENANGTIYIDNLQVIKIVMPNRAPSFTSTLDGEVIEPEYFSESDTYAEFTFQYEASDADGDNVTFSLVSGPSGAAISGDGLFSWTPTEGYQSYTIIVEATDGDLTTADTSSVTTDAVTAVNQEQIPTEFSMDQNYPNPFNPTTTIKFGLPSQAKVNIQVFNILGQEVRTLVAGNLAAGYHTINFDATNIMSGVYLYRISAQGVDGSQFTDVKKMILVK